MNDDLALLETAGCALQPFGQAGATLVTAVPAAEREHAYELLRAVRAEEPAP